MADTTIIPTVATETDPEVKKTALMIDGDEGTVGTLAAIGDPASAGVRFSGFPAGPDPSERGDVLCRIPMEILAPEVGRELLIVYFRALSTDSWTEISNSENNGNGDYTVIEDLTALMDGVDFSDSQFEVRYSRSATAPPPPIEGPI